MNLPLISSLVCPQTGQPLRLEQGELFTQETSYPLFDGVPWLFSQPEFAFLEWATKLTAYVEDEARYVEYLELNILQELRVHRRRRFELLLQAKQESIAFLKSLLPDFFGHQPLKLQPSNQQIHSYYKNVFRDWCWDNCENDTYLAYIQRVLQQAPKQILILGAGAGKLSQLVAQAYPSSAVYSLDHNPFMLLTAQKIFHQQPITLSNYSYFANTLERTRAVYTIDEQFQLDNHQFVLGSFPKLPFAPASIDCIIAPWFFDILEEDLVDSVAAAQSFLTPEGCLIQIGPCNVHHRLLDRQYTPEEMVEVYENLFEQCSFERDQVDYLKDPIESFCRSEQLLMLSGQQKKPMNRTEIESEPVTIQMTPGLARHKSMIETTHRLLQLIDKDMSADQLAKKVEQALNLSDSEARFYAESFIRKLQQDI